MRNSILISRIIRTVETSGGVGNGAELAQQYADAVNALNERLEATQTALSTGQTSEAVRLMEEEPKLVNEVGTLDFHQLAPWRALCSAQGWTPPPVIDQSLVDRILEIYNGSTMLEPALKAYRKAMRTRNDREIAAALRRLVALEPANADWARDLARAEATVQKSLAADFRAASTDDRREEIAADLLDTAWAAPPDAAVLAEASAWRSRREADRRGREQSEDIEILRKCESEIWSRSQAESLITHLDALAEQGTPIPPTEVAFVDSLRRRCADEAKAEADAARWADLMAALHAAVEHDSPDEIRRVMAEPEFLDRPPDEDLLRAARRVIRRAEEQRRRKTRLVVAAAIVVIAAIGGGTAKLYADRMFRAECDAQAAELEQLANAPLAHETLAKALDKLAEEKPKVYADPAVSAYREKLDAIRQQRAARLALARDAIEALEKERDGGWNGDATLLDETFQKAQTNVRRDEGSDDVELAKRLDAVQLDFEKVKGERHEVALAKAREELAPLIKESEILVARLRTTFFDDALGKNLADFRHKADLWNTSHSREAVEEAPKLYEALTALDAPEKRSKEAASLLVKISTASNAVDLVSSRESLRTHYGAFQNVKELANLPFEIGDLESLLAGTLASQQRFRADESMNEKSFRLFLDTNVTALKKDYPVLYSVYGFGDGENCLAFSTDRDAQGEEKEPSRGTGWKRQIHVAGRVLDAETIRWRSSMDFTVKQPGGKAKELLPPCMELRDVVDKAVNGATVESFAGLLWQKVREHIRAAKGQSDPELVESVPVITKSGVSRNDRVLSYVEQESDDKVTLLRVGRYPAYKRVQMVFMYLSWLRALGQIPEILPRDASLIEMKCKDLAGIVSVDGVEDLMSWVCQADSRIRAHNRKCAEFLSTIPDSFVSDLQEVASGQRRLRQLGAWRAEFAGQLLFDPNRANKCIPSQLPSVKADHPLYVLRKGKDGSPVLRKLLIDGKAKDTWMIVPGRGNDWHPGEPLFQVRDGTGVLVDASATIADFLKTLPKVAVDDFKAQPFWIELDP